MIMELLSRTKNRTAWRSFTLLVIIFGLLLCSVRVYAEAVIQGYISDEQLVRGQIVQLVNKDVRKVAPATADKLGSVHGVVVDPNDAPVTLTETGQKTFVATAGRYSVLVSSENGPIAVGDYVSVGSAPGIGAKSNEKYSHVLGKALEPFNGKANVLTNTSGGAGISRIIVDIKVGTNPFRAADKNYLPEFLRAAGEKIAGKPVPTPRMYLALAILFVTSFIAASLLYAGVRSAIISIGRNPLSKGGIIKGLIQVVIFGLIVFIVGIFGVYLLLKL